MTTIVNGEIAFDQSELDWFADNYSTTDWIVYVAGMDEIFTHDKQGPGEDPAGDLFTEATAHEHLHELDRRFGPGSPMDLGDPLYAVAMHHGVPAFGSHRHSHPCQPPHGTVWMPGDCVCGRPYWPVEAQLEAEMAAVEWSVYVTGPNSWFARQPMEHAGPPFTEDAAREYAMKLNEFFARLDAENPSPFNPVMRAVVLHRGQPFDETATTS
jgi:hypothetical protein